MSAKQQGRKAAHSPGGLQHGNEHPSVPHHRWQTTVRSVAIEEHSEHSDEWKVQSKKQRRARTFP